MRHLIALFFLPLIAMAQNDCEPELTYDFERLAAYGLDSALLSETQLRRALAGERPLSPLDDQTLDAKTLILAQAFDRSLQSMPASAWQEIKRRLEDRLTARAETRASVESARKSNDEFFAIDFRATGANHVIWAASTLRDGRPFRMESRRSTDWHLMIDKTEYVFASPNFEYPLGVLVFEMADGRLAAVYYATKTRIAMDVLDLSTRTRQPFPLDLRSAQIREGTSLEGGRDPDGRYFFIRQSFARSPSGRRVNLVDKVYPEENVQIELIDDKRVHLAGAYYGGELRPARPNQSVVARFSTENLPGRGIVAISAEVQRQIQLSFLNIADGTVRERFELDYGDKHGPAVYPFILPDGRAVAALYSRQAEFEVIELFKADGLRRQIDLPVSSRNDSVQVGWAAVHDRVFLIVGEYGMLSLYEPFASPEPIQKIQYFGPRQTPFQVIYGSDGTVDFFSSGPLGEQPLFRLGKIVKGSAR